VAPQADDRDHPPRRQSPSPADREPPSAAIKAAIDGRNDDQEMLKEIPDTAQSLIGSINSGLSDEIENTIMSQYQALDQLKDPITRSVQLSRYLIQQLELLKTQADQQVAESSHRPFWRF
jgi:hypothetical protein